MTTAHINDIDIYYEEHGDPAAEPVLLIMGFTGNAAAWAPQVPALAARYHVIAFDNRGAGRTTHPDGAYTIPGMAADAAALLDHLHIDAAHIVGVSMGGMIAQEFALNYPKRVRTLVLGCTTPGGPNSAGHDALMTATEEALTLDSLESTMTPERMKEALEQLFTPEYLANPGPGFAAFVASTVQYPPTLPGMKGQTMAIRAHDTFDRLPQIAAPTLVIAGDADPLVDPENSRILAARIPGAELVLLPNMRHGFNAEQPEQTNAALLDFLARHALAAEPRRA